MQNHREKPSHGNAFEYGSGVISFSSQAAKANRTENEIADTNNGEQAEAENISRPGGNSRDRRLGIYQSRAGSQAEARVKGGWFGGYREPQRMCRCTPAAFEPSVTSLLRTPSLAVARSLRKDLVLCNDKPLFDARKNNSPEMNCAQPHKDRCHDENDNCRESQDGFLLNEKPRCFDKGTKDESDNKQLHAQPLYVLAAPYQRSARDHYDLDNQQDREPVMHQQIGNASGYCSFDHRPGNSPHAHHKGSRLFQSTVLVRNSVQDMTYNLCGPGG